MRFINLSWLWSAFLITDLQTAKRLKAVTEIYNILRTLSRLFKDFLKTFSGLSQDFFLHFLRKGIFSKVFGIFWYWCYYPHSSRDPLSPTCMLQTLLERIAHKPIIYLFNDQYLTRHDGITRVAKTLVDSVVSLLKENLEKTWI